MRVLSGLKTVLETGEGMNGSSAHPAPVASSPKAAT
jgi:hypothetical protein